MRVFARAGLENREKITAIYRSFQKALNIFASQ
jgi:hypothetical protein